MCSSMSKSNFHFASSIKAEEEPPKAVITEKQGIVFILRSDCETTKSASLRRTLSADMSSKKWLAQNGFNNFSPMKKIASSEELAVSAANHSSSPLSSSFSEVEEEYDQGNTKEEFKRPGQDDVWRTIQSPKKPDHAKWTWGSILFEKMEHSSKLPPPYIPPLVRRSGSSLSEKSLEICTESLGSETGSDGFSSYPPSEVGDVEEEKENDQHQQLNQQPQLSPSYEDLPVAKYSYSYSKKMGPRSFPPPLPSLASQDGASVHMQSHRQNGRLVLEAVSVPSQKYFQAHREHGRLRLSFVNNPCPEDAREGEIEGEVEEFGQVFDNFEEIEENDEANLDDLGDDEGHEEEEEGGGEGEEGIEEEYSDGKFEMEENSSKLPGGLMNAHKPTTIMVKKLMGLDKKNLAWSSRFNKGVNLLDDDEKALGDEPNPPPLPQSLPPPQSVARLIPTPPPKTAAAASFNAYEYFWREKQPSMASIIKPISPDQCPPLKNNQNKVILASNLKGYEQQNLVLVRGNKADNLVPLLRRCNESRRSLLLWEPYCIAT